MKFASDNREKRTNSNAVLAMDLCSLDKYAVNIKEERIGKRIRIRRIGKDLIRSARNGETGEAL
jgi:hypothetical protein